MIAITDWGPIVDGAEKYLRWVQAEAEKRRGVTRGHWAPGAVKVRLDAAEKKVRIAKITTLIYALGRPSATDALNRAVAQFYDDVTKQLGHEPDPEELADAVRNEARRAVYLHQRRLEGRVALRGMSPTKETASRCNVIPFRRPEAGPFAERSES